jgi:hypothetical protein
MEDEGGRDETLEGGGETGEGVEVVAEEKDGERMARGLPRRITVRRIGWLQRLGRRDLLLRLDALHAVFGAPMSSEAFERHTHDRHSWLRLRKGNNIDEFVFESSGFIGDFWFGSKGAYQFHGITLGGFGVRLVR